MTIGIALSGGGAKGAAHVGMLQAFEENSIHIDMYAGTSAGSIVAAAKALGYTNKMIMQMMDEVSNKFLDFNYWGIIKDIPFRFKNIEAVMKGKQIRGFLTRHFDVPISAVKHPLSIVSTDVLTGAQVIFSSRNMPVDKDLDDVIKVYSNPTDLKVSDMVYSSAAIPGIFPPNLYDGRKLVDGSVVNNLPANVIKAMGADKIVVIDLELNGKQQVQGIVGVLVRAANIMVNQNTDYSLYYTKEYLYLDPEVNTGATDFSAARECYEIGYKYGKSVVNKVYEFVYEDA